ncbi:MAG: hypothetical protein HYU51_06310 [Candidatus Rokubacteria bacterium]|nr:hypothetical protein [Candidatus Rokubacteria bacterium]
MDTMPTPTQLMDRARLQARLEMALGLRDALLNPLAGLLGALQVLQSYPLPPERARPILAEAEREARRISAIVKNVGTVSRAVVVEVGPLRVADVAGACAAERG